jgi:Protein of unknown function (DUF2937)
MRPHGFITILAMVPALWFAQAPEFMQQYFQRIGGAVDELDRIVRHFDEDSARSGYDRSSALRVMANNSERLIRGQAVRMDENIVRLNRLREQQQTMKEGSAFARFSTFVTNYDPPLAQRTWDAYAFALPLTADGIMFALVGYVASFLGMLLLATPFLRFAPGHGR